MKFACCDYLQLWDFDVALDSDSLYLNLARLYVRLQERNKARDTLQRLLERKPNDRVATQALRQLDGLP